MPEPTIKTSADEKGARKGNGAPAGESATHRPRTLAAVRALIQAVGWDLARLAPRRRPRRPGAGGLRRMAAIVALVLAVAVLSGAGAMVWALRGLSVDAAMADSPQRTILLEASEGTPLGRIGAFRDAPLPREEFPDVLINAVLSIEDQRFYSHFGVDPIGIARAFGRNVAAGGIVEGGSTITQQLVKLRLLSSEQTFARKLREALAATWLELRYDKDEILTSYLNSIYLGAGAYGMPAAAQRYFGKSPAELSLQEAALLAGLIKAPSRYNPLENPEAAQRRAALVLNAMAQTGAISAEEAAIALQSPATPNPPPVASPAGSWFADWVSRESLSLAGSFQGPVRVRTTLDAGLQRLGEQVVSEALAENAARRVTQAALVAMRPDGAVLAMVGGRDYEQSQFNRAVQAERQPGSTFKLFVYLAALRAGALPDDVIDARPPRIEGWKPENFSDRDYGRVTLAEAFAKSINTATVNLALKVGLDEVAATARDLGIESPLQEVPSLALGVEETNLLDLTAAYAAVLAGQAPVEPWGVAALGPKDGERLMAVASPGERQTALGPARDLMIELLRLPVTRGTAKNAALDGFAAGKTGTSQDYRDAWFIGFDESLVVGIWVGNDDSAPMDEVTGGSLPAAMWKSFMENRGAARGEPVMAQREEGGAEAAEAHPGFYSRFQRERRQETADPTGPEADRARVCDVRACSRAYRSFDPSDCTYQPYGGGLRQFCDKGKSTGAGESEAVARGPQMQCDVARCARAYRSFRRSDCTYQPHGGGPRQFCDR